MSTIQNTKQALSSIDAKAAGKLWVRLMGVFGLIASAMIAYATAVLIVNELFLRWAVFEQGGPTFAATVQFAFQVPIVAAMGAAAARIATITSDGRWVLSRRGGALYAAGLATLAFTAYLYLLDLGVVAP